ncbi:MAG: hypothetical protein H6721_11610 [Sandaracinus sp.]|nr:hypothetical protein [Sandaracinus sp.]MCB9613101.1 hypothetical protein [Sandaracinus sp.]MCB9632769.1 hypothetical protein [Sandaracinus sp.]
MSDERIVVGIASPWGTHRVEVSFDEATIRVERQRQGVARSGSAAVSKDELDALRALALGVPSDEQRLVEGDFYAMGEERLRIALEGHVVEVFNATDRIRTPRAERLVRRCWELAETVVPW